jgi:hypothetical protein
MHLSNEVHYSINSTSLTSIYHASAVEQGVVEVVDVVVASVLAEDVPQLLEQRSGLQKRISICIVECIVPIASPSCTFASTAYAKLMAWATGGLA